MKKKVVIRGPLLTNSGYGYHARQVFEWLDSIENIDITCIVTNWGLTSWIVDKNFANGLIGKIMKKTKNINEIKNEIFDVSYQIQLPNEWSNIAKKNIGVTAAVETDKCNKEWAFACNSMNAVVVPSNFSKKNLKSSDVNISTPIHVIPEYYHHQFDNSDYKRDNDLKNILDNIKTDFNFLFAGQITGNNSFNDRKNIFNTIKWFCEEFKDNEEVGLILKLNSGQNTSIDKKVTSSVIERTLSELGKNTFPKVYLLHGNLNFNELKTMYTHSKVKCLLNLSRGEGYGLHVQEAAVNELPIIATNWSGHLDFLNLGKFMSVKHDLVNIHESRIDNKIFVEGSKWAEPDEKDAKRRMRRFYENPENPKSWAIDLSAKIKSNLNKEKVFNIYNKKLFEFTV